MQQDSILIDGVWQGSEQTMVVSDAYLGTVISTVSCANLNHAKQAVLSAKKGSQKSKRLPSCERYRILMKAADLIALRAKEFALSIVAETGKPIAAADKEVTRAINTLTLSAHESKRLNGETIPFDSVLGGEGRVGYYTYEPLGVIVCITPFNDPLNLVAHKLGPAIASGNSVILKPAEQAPLTALMLVQALIDSGLPEGIVNVLTGYGSDFGDYLVSHPSVSMVSFTGSVDVGEHVARAAGAKKLVMELGAISAVIVLDDADIERAVESCVSGAFWASGQNCIGVQRIYVQDSIYENFLNQFVSRTQELKIGDPRSPDTDVGPMVCRQQLERVSQLVEDSKKMGAVARCGGYAKNNTFLPTVFDDPCDTTPVVIEEVFGPVVSLFRFTDLNYAIEQANRPDYAIHGAVFTNNIGQAFNVANRLDVAGVMINDSTDYRLDAMPFGGAKRGSIGREGVPFSVREMCRTKVYCLAL